MSCLKRHITLILAIVALLSVNAATMDELREKLKRTTNPVDRADIMVDMYSKSLMMDDVELQVRCLNDLINYCHSTKQYDRESGAIRNRIVYFFNNDMNDSVIYHVPRDMRVLSDFQKWDEYYEIWAALANTYLYSGRPNQALRVAQDMFEDAKNRDYKLGLGIAYYTMGSIYTILNVLDESIKNYQKGLEIMSEIHPYPTILADLYPYYADVLNMKKDYIALEKLTQKWEIYLNAIKMENNRDEANTRMLYCTYYMACAQAAIGLHQIEKADEMMNMAKEHLDNIEDYTGKSWLLNMAKLRYQQGRYSEALTYNTQRLNMPDETDEATSYIDVIKQRAEILMKLGRYQEAAGYFERVYHINDSVNVQDTKQQLNELNTLFHVDELKMEQERAQFRSTLIIVGLIVLALIIFSVFRYIAAKRLKVAHEKLQNTHEELLTAYDQLEETTTAKERIESDLRIARNIQMSMVPHTFPDRADIDLYASMTPAKEVGGDLYGYLLLPAKEEGESDKLYFALGDVSGKGVPASLFMAQATRLFLTLAKQQMMPAEICTHLNDALSGEDNESSMFVTMFVGLIDLQTGHLDFCNAGHNPPVLIGEKAEFVEMIPNAPIGLFPGLDYEGEEIADILDKPFFVYTDGLNEAENRQQEQFSDERLLEILETTPFETSQKTIEMLVEQVEQHRDGAEPNDDLTMLCIKIKRNIIN